MGKTYRAAVIPLQGNERSVLDRTETRGQIVDELPTEVAEWLRGVHRAFCGKYTRNQKCQGDAAVDAHREADEYLLDVFRKICEVDHPSSQNPEIVQLSASCFVAGKNAGAAGVSAGRWNSPSPRCR